MEILAYVLTTLAAITFVVVSILYQGHKTPMVLLFGVAVLLADGAMCAFWLSKIWGAESHIEAAEVTRPVSSSPAASDQARKPSATAQLDQKSQTPPPKEKREGAPMPTDPRPGQPIDNRINNSPIVNSPGSIQAPGSSNLTINQAPQPRHLTAEQRAQLTSSLRAHRGFADIVWNGDGEAHAFALELNAAIKDAGWTTNDVAQGFFSGPVQGVILLGRNPPPPAAQAIFLALKNIGVRVEGQEDPNKPDGAWSLVIGARP